MIKKVWFEGIL